MNRRVMGWTGAAVAAVATSGIVLWPRAQAQSPATAMTGASKEPRLHISAITVRGMDTAETI
jgi:hypothetical protein